MNLIKNQKQKLILKRGANLCLIKNIRLKANMQIWLKN